MRLVGLNISDDLFLLWEGTGGPVLPRDSRARSNRDFWEHFLIPQKCLTGEAIASLLLLLMVVSLCLST